MNNGIPIWNYDRLLLRSSPHTIIRRSLHGVLLSTETTGEITFNSYDAFARIAQTWRAAILAATGTTGVPPVGDGSTGTTGVSPVAFYTYSPAGDLLATHTYTNDTDILTETYAYDLLGNRIATADALGNTTHRAYDPLGNVTAEWGATLYLARRVETRNQDCEKGTRPVQADCTGLACILLERRVPLCPSRVRPFKEDDAGVLAGQSVMGRRRP